MSGESEKKENVGAYTTEQAKLKLCIVCSVYIKHAEDVTSTHRFLHELLKRLVNLGAEVHVVVPHREDLKKEEIIDDVYIHRFQYMFPSRFQTLAYGHGIPENIKKFHNKLLFFPFMLFMALKLLRIIKKYDINLINAHWAIPSGLLAIMTKKLHKIPVVIKIYGVDLLIVKHKYPILKRLLKSTIINSVKVIANSDFTRDTAYEMFEIDEGISTIPDGVDTKFFHPMNNGSEIRQKYDLKNNVIFSSGRMVERKGFRYLIEALPDVLEKCSNTKLIIGGDGPERENLENLIATLGLRENVIFSGFIPHEDFPKYMAACDVFVLPAIIDRTGDTEGLGLVLVEAMASGRPVIGSNVGGIPYIINNAEKCGFLVEPKNVSELSEKIIILLKDERLREKFGVNGRKVVEERFSWDKIAERYLNELERGIEDKA